MDPWNPHSTKMASSPKFNQVENDCLIKQVIVNPGTVLYLIIIHHVLHHVLFIRLISYNFWAISLWPIYANLFLTKYDGNIGQKLSFDDRD